MKLFLCFFQVIICLSMIRKMYAKDKVNAVFLGAILIYSIFTEINYAVYPDFISKYVKNSEGGWYPLYFFITFSFVALYLFDMSLIRVKPSFHITIKDSRSRIKLSYLVIFAYSTALVFSIFTIVSNWRSLSYSSNVLKTYSRQIGFVRSLNDWNVYYFLIMITAIKKAKNRQKKRLLQLSCLLCFVALALFTLGNGDRSVILMCLVGWYIYYFYDKPLSFSNVRKMIPFIVIGLGYLIIIRIARSSSGNRFDVVKNVLQDDYAYPAMTIIAAINDAFIHPLTVIKAFITKGSVILPGNYLYWTLYEAEFSTYIQQAIATGANPGIGFHLFTEGYIFCGFLGFVYNGLFISILLRIWRHLYTTNDEQTNVVFAAIATGLLVIGVRSESAFFVRNMFFYMIPAIILYLLTCDKRIGFTITTHRKNDR